MDRFEQDEPTERAAGTNHAGGVAATAAPPRAVRYLTAEEILERDDIEYRDVEVPEWGGVVRIKTLTGRERATWQDSSMAGTGAKTRVDFQNYTVKLVIMACVNESGGRLFSEDQLNKLRRKSSAALERVATAAMELSGIGEDELEALGKNSKTRSSDDGDTD